MGGTGASSLPNLSTFVVTYEIIWNFHFFLPLFTPVPQCLGLNRMAISLRGPYGRWTSVHYGFLCVLPAHLSPNSYLRLYSCRSSCSPTSNAITSTP